MAEILKESEDDLKTGKSTSEELVIVETDGENQNDDERLSSSDESNQDSADDKEREAIRERRRLEKLERKERRDKAIARDKIELDFLAKRNDELERRLAAQEARAHQQDVSQVDAALREAIKEAQMADQVIAKAVSAGNGDDVSTAMRYREEALNRARQLEALKGRHSEQPPAQSQPRPPVVDAEVLEHAKDFMEDHSWYDPQGRDEKSAVVLAIDNAMAREGYDPKSDEYWDELRSRVKRRLPDAFEKSAGDKREPRSGPAVGSGREHAPTSTRREVYISPERKQALIDAGVWDDPVLRMKYVKRYAAYDAEHRK